MVDTSLLKDLFETDEIVARFLAMMIVEIPKSISDLENFVLNNEFENATISAHTLKSHLKYLGNDEISQLAQDIENMCENNAAQSPPHCTDLLLALKLQCEELVFELKEITT